MMKPLENHNPNPNLIKPDEKVHIIENSKMKLKIRENRRDFESEVETDSESDSESDIEESYENEHKPIILFFFSRAIKFSNSVPGLLAMLLTNFKVFPLRDLNNEQYSGVAKQNKLASFEKLPLKIFLFEYFFNLYIFLFTFFEWMRPNFFY